MSGAGARRATGLLLTGLLLVLSQPPRTLEPAGQIHTRHLQQVDATQGPGPSPAARRAAAADSAQQLPQNVSGTYRGSWGKQHLDAAFGSSFLSQQSGMVVFKLTTTLSFRPGVHNVQGDLVLRDGMYASEADVLLRVQGVYVVDVGRVMGVLEPVTPVTLPHSGHHNPLQLPDYRQALRQAASSWLSSESSSSSSSRTAQAAALSGGPRQCQFALELKLRHSNTTKQGGGAAGSEGLLRRPLEDGEEGIKVGHSMEDLVVNGTISSSNCGLVLGLNATTTHIEAYYAKAVNYTIMITALAFVQIMLLVRQMEASSTQALASKVSLLTIAQQALLDAYLCLLHLTVGIMVEPLFNAFAVAAFFSFCLFAIFEMRFLLSVWRARHSGGLDPWTAQRELSILYGRFYGALLGGILLSYYLQRFMKLAVFLLFSFWIPQIVLCVRTDCRQPLRPLYVVGMSLARLALPLYLYSCPKNLLRVAPSPWVCVCLVLFVGAQAAILLLQYYKGPRCFIPKRFLPPKYDYHRPARLPKDRSSMCTQCDIETGDGTQECVICMCPVAVEQPQGRMVTPCDHFFHTPCLERWMNVKMECPTCRRVLPPL